MADKLRGFATETFTLLVGPDEEEIHIPRGLLSQIPFFQQALIVNAATEFRQNGFKMLEYDPEALADVLYFFWTKTIPELDGTKKAGGKLDFRETVNARVKAYIVSQKLALGWIQNRIERQLVLHHQNHFIDPSNLILLHQAALRDTALYKFLMAELGYDFCKSSLETLESEVIGFTAVCEEMPREILWDFLKATDSGSRLNDENQPSKQAFWLNDSITGPVDMKDESENGHT